MALSLSLNDVYCGHKVITQNFMFRFILIFSIFAQHHGFVNHYSHRATKYRCYSVGTSVLLAL